MTEPRPQRRLAAIVCTDAVGYSRLMERDPEATLAMLKRRRAVIAAAAERHGGRVVGSSGDSLLLEFTSVVEAVAAAIEAQEALDVENSTIADERRMLFRMGVNLGDVLIDDDDIFGDGVNIAARLEALALPGGICIADEVHQLLTAEQQQQFADHGERSVKNIARTLHLWQWTRAPALPAGPLGGAPDGGERRTRVKITPFESRGGESEHAHFANDLADDIAAMFARTTAYVVVEEGEPSFDFAITGSLRWSGNRLRAAVQLVDQASGEQVWSERFERAVDDIFALEDEIAEAVVVNARMQMKRQEGRRLSARDEGTLNASELRSRAAGIFTSTTGDNATARRLLERADRLAPGNSMTLAMLGVLALREAELKIEPYEELIGDEVLALARRAVTQDAGSFFAHYAYALLRLFARCDHAGALRSARRAVEINPQFTPGAAVAALEAALQGDRDGGLRELRHAIDIDVRNIWAEFYFFYLAMIEFAARNLEEAAAAARDAAGRAPEKPRNALLLMACLGLLGRAGECGDACAELARTYPNARVGTVKAPPFLAEADIARYREGLRLAGLPA